MEETQRGDEGPVPALEEDELVLLIQHHLHIIFAATEGASDVSCKNSPRCDAMEMAHHLHTINGSFLGKISSMNGSSAGYCSRT